MDIIEYLRQTNTILMKKDAYEKLKEKVETLDKIIEIIEPLRQLDIDEMSDIEWQMLQVIDKYKKNEE